MFLNKLRREILPIVTPEEYNDNMESKKTEEEEDSKNKKRKMLKVMIVVIANQLYLNHVVTRFRSYWSMAIFVDYSGKLGVRDFCVLMSAKYINSENYWRRTIATLKHNIIVTGKSTNCRHEKPFVVEKATGNDEEN